MVRSFTVPVPWTISKRWHQQKSVVFQVGAMVAYIMDSLESRMGALGAVWISLGLTNLACMANLGLGYLHDQESAMMSVLLAASTGVTLFLSGELMQPGPGHVFGLCLDIICSWDIVGKLRSG